HQQYGKSAEETELPGIYQNLKTAIALATIGSKVTGTRKRYLTETVNVENKREIKRENEESKIEKKEHDLKEMRKYLFEGDECLK
ncbi:hypothetical protein CHS0354_027560, partial [Potamilus streckersoni]